MAPAPDKTTKTSSTSRTLKDYSLWLYNVYTATYIRLIQQQNTNTRYSIRKKKKKTCICGGGVCIVYVSEWSGYWIRSRRAHRQARVHTQTFFNPYSFNRRSAEPNHNRCAKQMNVRDISALFQMNREKKTSSQIIYKWIVRQRRKNRKSRYNFLILKLFSLKIVRIPANHAGYFIYTDTRSYTHTHTIHSMWIYR